MKVRPMLGRLRRALAAEVVRREARDAAKATLRTVREFPTKWREVKDESNRGGRRG